MENRTERNLSTSRALQRADPGCKFLHERRGWMPLGNGNFLAPITADRFVKVRSFQFPGSKPQKMEKEIDTLKHVGRQAHKSPYFPVYFGVMTCSEKPLKEEVYLSEPTSGTLRQLFNDHSSPAVAAWIAKHGLSALTDLWTVANRAHGAPTLSNLEWTAHEGAPQVVLGNFEHSVRVLPGSLISRSEMERDVFLFLQDLLNVSKSGHHDEETQDVVRAIVAAFRQDGADSAHETASRLATRYGLE